MKQSREMVQLQVGAFVGMGLLLFMVIMFMLGGEKKLFDPQYYLYCQFEDISGIRSGAQVSLAGIIVGSVANIEVNPDAAVNKITLKLMISKRYQDRIRQDSMANTVTQGLLGDKVVLITMGNPEKPALKEGEFIPTLKPVDFGKVVQKGDETLVRVNSILKEIETGKGLVHEIIYDPKGEKIVDDVDELSQNLNVASKDFGEILGKINRGEGTLGALVNDASVFNDIKTLLGKANRNKLVKAVIRYTLGTKEEKLIENKKE
ncbi:MAG TPA: hypothetical protein DDW49_00155 [Deltaproteobacteria bacterium]|nr:MAG: hypothetical protein A2048_01140 [Deltaproteobacteria bacterium GWA2_45_12]HBF11799.1 hypothetical protein [Deltaproteobacteria bacterium]